MKQTTLQNQHIFISHNSKDKTPVKKIAMWLKEQGLDPWLDEWEIQPGTSIQDSLEKVLKNSRAILICIGKNGSGPWHREEIKIAVRQAIHQHKTIIPLFLPGCPVKPEIPEFLKDKAGIDFRKGLHDEKACKDLLWSATGINPNHTGSQSGSFTPAGDLYDRPVMQEYARALVHRYEHIDFLGIPDLRDKRAVPLESIFVDLECRAYPYPRDNKALPVKDLLDNEKKLIILGDPGAGKSTLLKHRALTQARFLADNKKGPVPIIIVLRNYARWRTEPGRDKVSLLDYYYWHCRGDLNLDKLPGDFFEILLEQGLCCIYFDGYDELSEGVVRHDIQKVATDFFTVRYPGNRGVITSRIAGYERLPFDSRAYTHIKLAPLSGKAMEQFVCQWYAWKSREQGASDRERDERIADLLENLKNEQIKLLGENPLLLTMIAIIHRNEASLPEERFLLYEKITTVLLATWEKQKGLKSPGYILDKLRIRLAHIARWMHAKSEGKKERQTEVERQEIEAQLTKILMEIEPSQYKDDKYAAREEARQFLIFINQRAGLLVESGDGLYRFVHLSFQEYFTALYWFEEELGDRIWDGLYKSLIPNSHYREVLLLLFTMMVHGSRKRSASKILKQARELFWEHIGINPGTISRGMIIKNPEKVAEQLNDAYKQGAAKFLQFARSALVDCMHFETGERDYINNSFQRFELYNQFITISVMKSIQSIQVTTADYKKAHALDLVRALDLNLALARDLARARDLNLAFDFDLAFDLDHDLDHDHDLARVRALAHTLDLDFARPLARVRALDLDLNLNLNLDRNPLALKKLEILLNYDLNKINNNCHRIMKKTPAIINAEHRLYIRFSSLVLIHIGFILFYHWRFLEYKLEWNYPDLDRFVDTAGGLLTNNLK